MHGMRTILLFLFINISCFLCKENLYNILGVSKSATQDEIRKAYKTLAREWHPDKNKSPNANERFIKINEAYETLSDPEKRENYNQYGTTSAQNNQMHDQRQSFDGFHFHFGGSPFHFNFPNFGQGSSKLSKYRIDYGEYLENIIPQSFINPTIIYAYVDYCILCHQLSPIWEQFITDLNKIGFGIGTLNANHDSRLTQKLGINSVPALFAIIEGKVKRFSLEFNIKNLREFARNIFPANLITELTEENYNEFMETSSVENKILVITFDTRKSPSLRYLAAAFSFRNFVKAAYANVERFKDNRYILNQFKIARNLENFLIFQEDTNVPVAKMQMDMIPRSAMDELIESKKYLKFPRISNQHFFDQVCPSQQSIKITKLCILLLLRNSKADNKYKDLFFEHLKFTKLNDERVKFAYVFDKTQTNLIQAITHGEGVANDSLNLRKVIIMMRSNNRLDFDILGPGWPLMDDKNFNSDQIWTSLEDLTKHYLSFSRSKFPFSAQMNFQIIDENQSFIHDLWLKLQDWREHLLEYFASFDEWTLVAMVSTVIFAVFVAFIFKIMAISSDQPFNTYADKKPQNKMRSDNIDKSNRLNLSILNEESYQTVFKCEDRNVRFLILILNKRDSPQIISMYIDKFVDIVFPYFRMTMNLRFFVFYVDGSNTFLTQLVSQSHSASKICKNLTLNQLKGSVLVVNPTKKYFHLYLSTQRKMDGEFLGLDDEDDDDSLYNDDFFFNFGHFVDRMFEGTLERHSVTDWPKLN